MEPSDFGRRLRQLLTEKKMPQKEVAAALGVSPTAVGNWVKGAEISFDRVKALAAYLDVSWLWLRYGDEGLDEARKYLGERREVGILNENRRKFIGDMMAYQETVRRALDLANMVIWDWNLVTGDVTAYGNIKGLYCIDRLTHIDQLLRHVLPRSRAQLDAAFEQAIACNKPCYWEFEYRQPETDKIIWVGARGHVLHDELGAAYKLVGIAYNVTKAKLVELRLQLAMDATNAGLFVVDLATGRITHSNAREAELLGLPSPDALQTADDFLSRVPREDRDKLPANGEKGRKRQQFASGDKFFFEHQVQDESGKILRKIRTHSIFYDYDDDGIVDAMIGISVDTGDRPYSPKK